MTLTKSSSPFSIKMVIMNKDPVQRVRKLIEFFEKQNETIDHVLATCMTLATILACEMEITQDEFLRKAAIAYSDVKDKKGKKK